MDNETNDIENDLILESEQDYDDLIENAPEFKITTTKFKNDIEKDEFNSICKNLEKEIYYTINIIKIGEIENHKLFTVYDQYLKLDEERKTTLTNRAFETSKFLEDNLLKKKKSKNNPYKFTRWIKYICSNLISSITMNKPIRYSHKSPDYSGYGQYAKMHLKYIPFMLIFDILELYGYVDLHLGDKIRGRITRLFVTEKGKQLLNKLAIACRLKEEFEVNKRGYNYDLVRLTKVKDDAEKLKHPYRKETSVIPLYSNKYVNNNKFRPMISELIKLEKNVNLINTELNKHKLEIRVENLTLKTTSLLDLIYINYIYSRIDDLSIVCSINGKDKINYEYLDKIRRLDNIIIILIMINVMKK